MPTVDWNKRWAKDLKRFESRGKPGYYGAQWGDPSTVRTRIAYWIRKILSKPERRPELTKVVHNYISPYLTKKSVVLEIGPGGGRWTRYLLQAKEIILVDLNAEFFPYLKNRAGKLTSKMRFKQTAGYELGGIDLDSVDFIFTFGTFVHIDPDGIDSYLGEMKRVLKPGGIAVVQYADKNKKAARERKGFSDMNCDRMNTFVQKHGFKLLDHNLSLLDHSNIVVIQK
jgi:SAM-dependent methyltransferase